MSEWQPIESAPYDEEILAYGPNEGIRVVKQIWGRQSHPWVEPDGDSLHRDSFDFWMPLPTPPKDEK